METHGDYVKYDPAKLTDKDAWDTIVIGSGIGGLAAASLIAQDGQTVLVLEQHWAPGGCCHTFTSNGYRFGTGIYHVGDMGDKGGSRTTKQILDSLTPAEDPVIWDKIDEPFETTILGAPSSRYEKVADLDTYKKHLIEKFPKEEKGIEDYFLAVNDASHAFQKSFVIKALPLLLARALTWTGLHQFFDGGYSKWAMKSLQEVLEGITDDKELQAVLASNYADVGTDPSHAPFVLHAALVYHYRNGAFYPHGGASTIPAKIIKCICSNGGKVMVSAKVKRILIDEHTKKVTGVEMYDGTEIKAKVVVSDVGLINTATHLLPSGLVNFEFDEGGHGADPKLHPSQTCLSLFVGLHQDSKTQNLPTGNYYIHPSNDLVGNFEKLQKMSLEEALQSDTVEEITEGETNHLGPIFVNVPSMSDKAWEEEFPGKSTLEIFAFLPWSWFESYESKYNKETKSHGKEYETAKLRLADKMWKRVVEVFEPTCPTLPKGLESIDHYRIGTPLTYSHFLSSEHGALFGLDHDMKRFEPKTYYLRLRPKVAEVPGLYLAGQDVTCGGFVPAMMGGLLCAGNVLNVDDPFTLLSKVPDVEAIGEL